eukprot:1941157-Prymnesium_polylepis.1
MPRRTTPVRTQLMLATQCASRPPARWCGGGFAMRSSSSTSSRRGRGFASPSSGSGRRCTSA